jgi:hypothetical protein
MQDIGLPYSNNIAKIEVIGQKSFCTSPINRPLKKSMQVNT